MLEYGLDEPIVAFVLDGTGLGDDGKVWGGEIFLCDRREYNDFLNAKMQSLWQRKNI